MASSAKRVRLSESTRCRNEGNAVFKSIEGLSPLLRSGRLQQVVSLYTRALDLAEDATDRSSAYKNLAMASWKLATAKMALSDVGGRVVFHHFKDSLKYFKDAEQSGRERDGQWRETLRATALECWSDMKQHLDAWEKGERKILELQPLLELLLDDATLAKEQLGIARALSSCATAVLAKRDFKKALSLLGECSFPLNEALRLGKADWDLTRECHVLEAEIFDQRCVAESIQARTTGEKTLKMLLTEAEDLNTNMVWEVIDCYRNAALLSRERDCELEAMALSALGRVYAKVLKLKSYAKPCLMKAVEIVNNMVPQRCLSEEWYLFACNTLQQYQQEAPTDMLKKQKERDAVMKEIKGDLEKLNEKFAKSSKKDFLKYVYATHPPKNPNYTLQENAAFDDDDVLKKLYFRALTHYHPDRVDEIKDGTKWKILSEEITKLLTIPYAQMFLHVP